MKKNHLFLWMAAVCLCATGCAPPSYLCRMYSGSERPAASVAKIYISGGLDVKAVSGRKRAVFEFGRFDTAWRYPEVLEVLPGPCKLKVSREGAFFLTRRTTTLSLEAKAGHSYVVGLIFYTSEKTGKKSWRAVVIDKGLDYEGGCSPDPVYRTIE